MTWTVARLWTTPVIAEALPLPRDTTRVIVGVDGVGTLRIGMDEMQVRPMDMVLLQGDARVTAECTSLWARTEWQLASPALRQARFAAHLSRSIPLREEHYTLLTAMTNVISTSERIGHGSGAGAMLETLAGVAMAAVIDATDEHPWLPPSRAAIVRRAREAIDRRHTDPGFGLTELAAELHVSVRSLTRAFAATGTTAREAIERRRLATVDSLAVVNAGWALGDKDALAQAAGFSSARHLELTQRRHR
ncbi:MULTISPECIES: hypothetical protein [Bacteria]|uniref:hypothetical protein n=1 Tax=Bacteria TaxID=2 RepID=UPI003C7E4566